MLFKPPATPVPGCIKFPVLPGVGIIDETLPGVGIMLLAFPGVGIMLDAAPGVGIMLFIGAEETTECGGCFGTIRRATDCSRCSNVLRSAYSSCRQQAAFQHLHQHTLVRTPVNHSKMSFRSITS